MRIFKRFFFVASLFALGLGLEPQELSHVVSVINIEVPVRVYKGDRFVSNLSIRDFELFEDGKPQKIEAVYLIQKTSVKRKEGPAAPVLAPPVANRHFILFFEVDDYLPELGKVVDRFFGSVVAPQDTVWIVTPKSSIQLKKDALAKTSRKAIAEQMKSRLKKDIVAQGAELRSLVEDLRRLAKSESETAKFEARNYLGQIRDLKTFDQTRVSAFADLLKTLDGSKHVFIIYQKEEVIIPDMFRTIAEELEFIRTEFVDQEKVQRLYADVSATIHFLFVTKTRADSGKIAFSGPGETALYSPSAGAGDFFDAFNQLAVTTGGRMESSANAAWAFEKAVEATEQYYLLYYKPTDYKADGKFHEIIVKVKGGYKVSHRLGYFAKEESAMPRPGLEKPPEKPNPYRAKPPEAILPDETLPPPMTKTGKKALAAIPLEEILKQTAAYCARLEDSALRFVCEEKAVEYQYLIQTKIPHKNEWLYDYQLIRRGGEVEEKRTLLQENGKEKREENAALKTSRVWYKNVIMGPVGLLSSAAQQTHTYKVLDEETLEGAPVVIIEVKPIADLSPGLYGKAWVRRSDSAILKIEWTPESVGNYEKVVEFAEQIGARPSVTFYSEYAFEKNGIRFPSSYGMTEAYIVPNVGRLLRSRMTVDYKDYKFFTVETDVTIKNIKK